MRLVASERTNAPAYRIRRSRTRRVSQSLRVYSLVYVRASTPLQIRVLAGRPRWRRAPLRWRARPEKIDLEPVRKALCARRAMLECAQHLRILAPAVPARL